MMENEKQKAKDETTRKIIDTIIAIEMGYALYNLSRKGYDKTMEKEKQIVIDETTRKIIYAITNALDIEDKKISTEKKYGLYNVLLEVEDRNYEICSFEVKSDKISILLDKYGFEDAGLGKITKELAEKVANYIKENGTSKEIYVYKVTSDGDGYSEKLLYPKKSWKDVFRRTPHVLY